MDEKSKIVETVVRLQKQMQLTPVCNPPIQVGAGWGGVITVTTFAPLPTSSVKAIEHEFDCTEEGLEKCKDFLRGCVGYRLNPVDFPDLC